MKSLLPIALRNDEHYEAVAELIEEFVALDNLEMLVPLMVETAPPQVRTHLAEFFSILGIEGWEFVQTDEEKIALLRQAVDLHRHKGTPWAIEQGVKRVGYQNVYLEEGAENFTHRVEKTDSRRKLYLNGSFALNGTYYLGGGVGKTAMINTLAPAVAWAFFRVIIRLANTDFVDAAQVEKLRLVINEYKPLRSWLSDIGFVVDDVETQPIQHNTPSNHIRIRSTREYWKKVARLDGTYRLNGDIRLGGNGITDRPNPIFTANVRLNGTYRLNGAISLNGTTTKGAPNFPVNLGFADVETVTISETDRLLINP